MSARATPRRTPAQPSPQAVAKIISKALEPISALTDTLNTTMFGFWDKEKNQRVGGVIDQLQTMNARMDTRDRRDRFVWAGFGLAMMLVTLQSVGVPTKSIGEGVATFWNFVITHGGP